MRCYIINDAFNTPVGMKPPNLVFCACDLIVATSRKGWLIMDEGSGLSLQRCTVT